MVVAKGGVKVLRMLRIVGAVLWQSWGWSCVRGRRCGQRRSKCLALLIDDWKALRYRAINTKEFPLHFGVSRYRHFHFARSVPAPHRTSYLHVLQDFESLCLGLVHTFRVATNPESPISGAQKIIAMSHPHSPNTTRAQTTYRIQKSIDHGAIRTHNLWCISLPKTNALTIRPHGQ